MSSILYNSSAAVALSTLKNIGQSMSKIQADVATGKSVATAKDNSVVWAISKVMQADVASFEGIASNLSLGSSTVAVAGKATASITDLLTQMKTKIVSAQEANVDRAKIQSEIVRLRDQVSAVVGAAQFNGLNLLEGNDQISILASLDRDGTQVNSNHIEFSKQDLGMTGYTALAVFDAMDGDGLVSGDQDTFSTNIDAGGAEAITFAEATYNEGDSVAIRVGGRQFSYTVTASDLSSTNTEVTGLIASGLKSKIDAAGMTGLTVEFTHDGTVATLNFDNQSDVALSVSGQYRSAGAGGLSGLNGIDVSTDHQGALAAIDGMIAADMEETSARMNALQVQQQLGIQALSIANQGPQNLLALFRG